MPGIEDIKARQSIRTSKGEEKLKCGRFNLTDAGLLECLIRLGIL